MHNYSQNSAKCCNCHGYKTSLWQESSVFFQLKACILPCTKSAMTGSKLHWVGELKKMYSCMGGKATNLLSSRTWTARTSNLPLFPM